VVAPVAIAWDDAGRLYAVEMRGFMPNLAGEGEEAPSGRVVVLEDTDRDGRMDVSHVLRDGLVLPRAIAVLPEGVLLGVPPDLWLCPPFEVDRNCRAPRRLTHYGRGRHDPEHSENGLLPALDGWIYNAKSERRFRLDAAGWREATTAFRGQWGIAQDDEGRLFTNHNSAFLFVDLQPAEYLARHPATDPRTRRPGVAVALVPNASVHGIRVAPGLNRAYLPDVLRRDGRQNGPTAVAGLALNRANLLGAGARGDVFVPEPAGNVVARFRVRIDGLEAQADQLLSDDPDWGEREFLASTDERCPVNVAFGPDGALYVVDMYRGVIQHANFRTDHLREHVERQGLEATLEQGGSGASCPGAVPEAPPDLERGSTAERVALSITRTVGYVTARSAGSARSRPGGDDAAARPRSLLATREAPRTLDARCAGRPRRGDLAAALADPALWCAAARAGIGCCARRRILRAWRPCSPRCATRTPPSGSRRCTASARCRPRNVRSPGCWPRWMLRRTTHSCVRPCCPGSAGSRRQRSMRCSPIRPEPAPAARAGCASWPLAVLGARQIRARRNADRVGARRGLAQAGARERRRGVLSAQRAAPSWPPAPLFDAAGRDGQRALARFAWHAPGLHLARRFRPRGAPHAGR
jgi:hypothetical protein